jgi:hypothetical protein
MTTTTRLSTSDVDAAEGFDYWAEAVSSTFVPLECSTTLERPFLAELVSIGIDDLQLTRVTRGVAPRRPHPPHDPAQRPGDAGSAPRA